MFRIVAESAQSSVDERFTSIGGHEPRIDIELPLCRLRGGNLGQSSGGQQDSGERGSNKPTGDGRH
jgi:hypothetical protein